METTGGPGTRGSGALELNVLFWALFAGILLYAIVAFVLATMGMIRIDWSPGPAVRGAITLLVGLGSFAGLRIARGAYHPPRTSDASGALGHLRGRSIAGWALIEGVGLVGVCLGLVTANPRMILLLAGLSMAGMFLARPDTDQMRAVIRRAEGGGSERI